ncbi:MAG TPA: hypothetical protein VFC16_00955 [Nakamurella sp.]|nr:hypothetical protein [Nakamurella sp.]
MTTVRQLPDTRRFSGCTAIVTAADGRTRILANVAGVMEGFLPPAEVGDAIGDAAFAVNCAAILSASGRRRCGGHDRTRFIRAVLPAKLAAESAPS